VASNFAFELQWNGQLQGVARAHIQEVAGATDGVNADQRGFRAQARERERDYNALASQQV